MCWPCHESCETCAGAGQDSCLTCAPAHLHVTDLAVCLQQCPDGYYESEYYEICVVRAIQIIQLTQITMILLQITK